MDCGKQMDGWMVDKLGTVLEWRRTVAVIVMALYEVNR
jgi:hypothetical protein